MQVVYEDNHIIVVNKAPGEIVQGDKTGDYPLCDMVKDYLKEKYNKPGNVFCGVVHRIDRPVGGLVIFAKTSKALSRLNEMLRKGEIHKTYRAIVQGKREKKSDTLTHFLTSDGRINKSFVSEEYHAQWHKCILKYNVIAEGAHYSLLEIQLLTGRKHQIRAQLSATGTPIRGDLKYGAKRSNPDASISLLAYHLEFMHPVSHQPISLYAPTPLDPLWAVLIQTK
jgi:23S rRNA pseudouridine1911/1915/1917 synthase